jgi:tetratricopeptide (TPR) repeat protein
MSSKQRDRGRILTTDGLSRLQQAIRAWELEHEVRCTQERIKELTSAVKESGLDPGTTRKILRAKEGVDPESIRCLFTTFGLQLDEADLAPSSRLQVQADPNFVGREGASADLNVLVNRGAKVIVIQARGGVGKTTLARKYLQQEFGSFLEFPIAKETKDIASIESLIEEKLRQLGEEPGREFFVSLDRLKRKLQDERIGILIDNLEPALDSTGKFIEPHRRYVELLRVLTDPLVQSVTFITSRERLRESSVTVEHYMLRNLNIEAWGQFFQSRNLATDAPAFAALHNAYGGNAKAMDIIRGAILEDYAGDVAAYWQANQHDLFIERDLEDLVTQQFDRLQQIDADAYNLLCRMGCYRYQDVPTVPIEGLLCLLWDVSENRQRRVVKSLQDRSLVEFENGLYWLHPVIRSEAINRLRISEAFKVVSIKAAEFWTQSVKNDATMLDAFIALEAYYHYLEVNEIELAADVIVRRRNNTLLRSSTLGGSFFRLGLFQQMIFIISRIISSVQDYERLGILYDILGSLYLANGDIKEAINCYQQLEEIAQLHNSRWMKLIAFLGTGCCKISLWELEDAIHLFEKSLSLHSQTDTTNSAEENSSYAFYYHGYRIAISYFCLVFLKSTLGFYQTKELIYLAEKSYHELLTKDFNTSRRKGHGFIFLGLAYKNLEQYEKAIEMLNIAISFADESYHIQVKAVALTGLAEIHRLLGNFEISLSIHSKAISLLEEIGAKCDLAEAHYQLGLTYQAMNEFPSSDQEFQKAIQIFARIEAPKQVEKVEQAIATLKTVD